MTPMIITKLNNFLGQEVIQRITIRNLHLNK